MVMNQLQHRFYRFSPAKSMQYGVKGLNMVGGIGRFVFWEWF
ncbi:hypothetical protein [Planococcus beigongshangi]|nr:hypothetical protein [Planococcus beigongshangi]